MRQFSVIRRRPKLVDIVTPFVYGITEYRIKWASTMNGPFTQIIAAPNAGFCDPEVPRETLQPIFNSGQVRIAFDPTATAWSITNPDQPLWLQLTRYDGTTETYESAPTLLLPEASRHGPVGVTVGGTAPSGASIADSLRIDLPWTAHDIRIRNEMVGTDLYVATEANGGEIVLSPTPAPQTVTLTLLGTASSLYVRGSGGTATFTATFSPLYTR